MLKTAVTALAALVICSANSQAFNAYEHSEMGDAGFRAALATLDESRAGSSRRLLGLPHLKQGSEGIGAVVDGKVVARFSFGDLIAIYGDYAGGFEEVNSPAIAQRAEALKKIAKGAAPADFPEEFSAMMRLAENNPTHFSRRAAETYVKWHGRALSLAATKNRLWEALHYEAMALHSFTDLFAFGHMLDNRELTERLFKWAKEKKGPNYFILARRASIARAGGKLMGGYVNFYHNAYNWRGAMMKNIAGDRWRGFGDRRYRIVDASCTETSIEARRNCPDKRTQRQRQIVVHAVSTSILSVLKAASGRSLPAEKEYAAMCYLPVYFWDTQAPVPAENQVLSIARLASAMEKQGRSITNEGFDFSLGHLKFQRKEKRGGIDYLDYVRSFCR